MPDSNLPNVDRREFLQAGVVATAAAASLTVGSGSTLAADDAKPDGNKPVLPKRKLGKTGVEVTLLNQGTVGQPAALDRILRPRLSRGGPLLRHRRGLRNAGPSGSSVPG